MGPGRHTGLCRGRGRRRECHAGDGRGPARRRRQPALLWVNVQRVHQGLPRREGRRQHVDTGVIYWVMVLLV